MCKVCNLTHQFKSNLAAAYVCPACQSILYKGVSYSQNKPEESFKIFEDLTPFALGTKLSFEDRTYDFIGRYQFVLTNGNRNLWFLHANDENVLYLLDQPGGYVICKKNPHTLKKSDYDFTLGRAFEFPETNKLFYLSSKQRNTMTRMEGEVFDIQSYNMSFDACDFANDKQFVFGLFFGRMNNDVYVGQRYHYSELKLLNMRKADG